MLGFITEKLNNTFCSEYFYNIIDSLIENEDEDLLKINNNIYFLEGKYGVHFLLYRKFDTISIFCGKDYNYSNRIINNTNDLRLLAEDVFINTINMIKEKKEKYINMLLCIKYDPLHITGEIISNNKKILKNKLNNIEKISGVKKRNFLLHSFKQKNKIFDRNNNYLITNDIKDVDILVFLFDSVLRKYNKQYNIKYFDIKPNLVNICSENNNDLYISGSHINITLNSAYKLLNDYHVYKKSDSFKIFDNTYLYLLKEKSGVIIMQNDKKYTIFCKNSQNGWNIHSIDDVSVFDNPYDFIKRNKDYHFLNYLKLKTTSDSIIFLSKLNIISFINDIKYYIENQHFQIKYPANINSLIYQYRFYNYNYNQTYEEFLSHVFLLKNDFIFSNGNFFNNEVFYDSKIESQKLCFINETLELYNINRQSLYCIKKHNYNIKNDWLQGLKYMIDFLKKNSVVIYNFDNGCSKEEWLDLAEQICLKIEEKNNIKNDGV